ncbi:MAG: hypothetical protein V3U45_05945 [bacterium]
MRRYRPTRAKRPKGLVAAIQRHMARRASLAPEDVPAWQDRLGVLYGSVQQDDGITDALKRGELVEDSIREVGIDPPPMEVGELLQIVDKDRVEVCTARLTEDLGPDPDRPGHRLWRLRGE